MKKNQKLLLVVLAIIIIAGIGVTATLGLNVGIEYGKAKQVQIYLGTDVDLEKVKIITEAVFPDQKVELQKVELFNDEVSITVDSITDKQLETLNSAFNHIYDLDNKVEDLDVIEISGINIWDLVTPYIIPLIIALAIIIAYIIVKYRKLGILKVALTPITAVCVAELLFLSLLALTRMSVNRYTMPLAMAILIITITTVVVKFEKESN